MPDTKERGLEETGKAVCDVRQPSATLAQELTAQHHSKEAFEHTHSSPSHKPHLPEGEEAIKYGELVVVGYNGHLTSGDKGRRRSKYVLWKRSKANGVKPSKRHFVSDPKSSKAVQDSAQHSVSYTLSRNRAIIVEYQQDEDTDMFQIGRSSEGPIDFVVMDTIPGCQRSSRDSVTQSTISRFACRILVDRNPPYTARIFAAGFDAARNIFLGEKAVKWYSEDDIDGLTTNGVFVMKPVGGFTPSAKPGVWREISVGGNVFSLRESRPLPNKIHQIPDEDNILRDGTLIDLCGVTLLWRSALGLITAPSEMEFQSMINQINAGRPQCPVGLNTLVLPSKGSPNLREKHPYVYLACGHVHGKHEWGQSDSQHCTCPLCLKTGPFVKLQMGCELSLYVDAEYPTFCFSPCAHVASESTVKYWSQVQVPHGSQGFQVICPFCSTPLCSTMYIKLIFQDHTD
ncbi:protein pellino-like [Pomacea canaliculata]|uniref:protein pellino-like n=1 Tax=Pomacea canaliculata TaxID=400727 RepID=UPI000D737B83|nr:protein pellino-like [Pomacea canaliculata]